MLGTMELGYQDFKKNADSKSIINDPLPRITCFRVAVFSELG